MGLKQIHRSDPKISRQHSSFIEGAAEIVDFLIQNPRCTRISGAEIGKGKPCQCLKTKIEPTGIILRVHYGGNRQTLYVVPKNGSAEELVREIKTFFQEKLLAKKEQRARQLRADKQTLRQALAPAAF